MTFDEKMKLRAQREDCPLPPGFRERLEAAVEETMEGGKRPVKKRMWRTALLAAALCAALTVTALAASPTLREALAAALGSFAPYSRTVEDLFVEDQGMELRVVSTLSDGTVARVYFELRDLEGERLDQFTSCNLTLSHPLGTQWKSSTTYPARLVSYDPETGTALFVARMVGDGPPVRGLTLEAQANVISPGQHFMTVPMGETAFSEDLLSSRTLEGGEVVLEPGQTPADLGSDLLSLSSQGFGADGRFHQLFRLSQEPEHFYLRTFLKGRAWEAGEPEGTGRHNRYNQGYRSVTFYEEGALYCDLAYGAQPEDAPDLSLGDLTAQIATAEDIHGDWGLTIPFEDAPVRQVELGEDIVLGGVTGRRLHLTAIGATLESDPAGSGETLGYPVTLYLSDSSTLPVGAPDAAWYGEDYATNHWSFPEPVAPEEITGMAIGLWYLPLEGNEARPGHWLETIP